MVNTNNDANTLGQAYFATQKCRTYPGHAKKIWLYFKTNVVLF